MKIAIIILNWNQAQETLECLHSVSSISFPNYEIILVDNGSKEGNPQQFQQAYPDIHLIRNEKNLGFAEGNNRGIAYALERGADAVFLLNNDARVDPTILTAFKEATDLHPDAGVFGAKIYFYEEPTLLWYTGGEVDVSMGRCCHKGCMEWDLEKKWETITDTGYACGCALFIRADVIRKVGMMDPRYFLIWEEIDWCWRIRQAGYRCLFVPKARVWHKISVSFEGGHRGPQWFYFYWRNRMLFFKDHYPSFLQSSVFWKQLAGLVVDCIHPRSDKKKKQQSRASFHGVIDYYRGKFGPRP